MLRIKSIGSNWNYLALNVWLCKQYVEACFNSESYLSQVMVGRVYGWFVYKTWFNLCNIIVKAYIYQQMR